MHILYFFFVKIVEWLLPAIASLSKNKKLNLFVKGRKDLFKNLKLADNPNRYWVHCASLGEFEQARPIIEKLKQHDTTISIVVSFFSPSGYEQKKNYDLAEAIIYLPLDTPSNADKLVRILNPKAAVFVKYEIWYFYLNALFRKNIPVYLISANFRANQYIFSFSGKWLFNLLPKYKYIFLQNEPSLRLLKSKGLTNISISGDTRYDRVLQNAQSVKENEFIHEFKANSPLLILGSSWPKEEDILLQYLGSVSIAQPNTDRCNAKEYKVIIAPHDISEKHISEIQNKFRAYNPVLYTELNKIPQTGLMILNTIGHLASAYHYANIAFVGGGFTGQLHNILEPLAFGVPVITGPIHHKFPEAELAKKEGVLFETLNAETLSHLLQTNEQGSINDKARAFVKKQAGASELIVKTMLGSL